MCVPHTKFCYDYAKRSAHTSQSSTCIAFRATSKLLLFLYIYQRKTCFESAESLQLKQWRFSMIWQCGSDLKATFQTIVPSTEGYQNATKVITARLPSWLARKITTLQWTNSVILIKSHSFTIQILVVILSV